VYFSIPNSRATAVTCADDPLGLPKLDYAQFGEDKKAYRKWCQDLSTNHNFLSCCEGVAQGLRVSSSKDNAVLRCHGVIVNYGTRPPDGAVELVTTKPAAEFGPQYFVHTFTGGCYLVWEFEKPFYPANEKHFKAFMQRVAKSLSLNSWLPGFEAGSLGDASHYYELGDWEQMPNAKPIPASHIELWAIEAAKRVVISEDYGQDYDIPMERLYQEIEDRFPGKWVSTFEEGSRGPAFWSQEGGSSNSCVVFKAGIYCFSETVGAGFYPWRRIFGKAFVEQFEADKMKEILESPLYYDGQKYWRRAGDTVWDCLGREDFCQELRLKGWNGKIARGETCSEIDRVEAAIKSSKRVSGVMPFLFYPEGKIWYEGDRYLNTSRVKPLAPAAPFGAPIEDLADGRSKFPFLYKLLTTMFYNPDADGRGDDFGELQIERFMAWLKFFYVQSLKQEPRPGHAIVLAGPPDKGKTFLFKHILANLMGGSLTGSSDGTGHMAGGERWTDRLIRTPLILIDDNLMSSDPREVTRFTARVKKYVSSPTMVYEQKYRTQAEIPWFGRIVVLCNTDPEGLRMLPNMSLSVRDKISLFKASEARMKFGTWEQNQKITREELPNLARFLVDWEIPERSAAGTSGGGGDRFGVKAYHHPELMDESLQSGLDGIILELLVHMMQDVAAHNGAEKGNGDWLGSYIELHSQLSVLYERIMHDVKPMALASCLGNLNRNGYDVTQLRGPAKKGRARLWRIGRDPLRTLNAKKREELGDLAGPRKIDGEEDA